MQVADGELVQSGNDHLALQSDQVAPTVPLEAQAGPRRPGQHKQLETRIGRTDDNGIALKLLLLFRQAGPGIGQVWQSMAAFGYGARCTGERREPGLDGALVGSALRRC